MASFLPNIDVPISIGAHSTVVLQLQQLLNRYMAAGLVEDGIFGQNTSRATDRAFVTLQNGPSWEARNITAGGPSGFTMMGELLNALVLAFDAWAPAALPRAGSAPAPAAPPTTITMNPNTARQMGVELGITPPAPTPWGTVLVVGGVLAGLGALAMALRSGRRAHA